MVKIEQYPNYKSLDRIVLKKRDELGTIIKWSFDNLDIIREFTTAEYPLTKGVIQIEYPRAEVLFSVAGRFVTIGLFYYGEHYLTFLWDSEDTHNENIKIMQIESPEEWGQEKVDQYIKESILTVNGMMAYMVHFRQDVESTTTRKQVVKKDKKGKKKQNTRFIKIGYHYVTPKERPKAPADGERRQYERQAESWSVKGHFRKYKSGKEVWIKPQVRGKKSGERKAKNYVI
jgi:hypothetical protein